MDKININSFATISETIPVYVQAGEITYEILPRISTDALLEGIQWAISVIVDDRPFISYPVQKILLDLAMVRTFTSIAIDDEELLRSGEIYDILNASGVFDQVWRSVAADQMELFEDGITKSLKSIIDYKNSARGIVDALSAQATDSTAAMEKNLAFIADEGNLEQIRGLLAAANKLGYNPDA